jgi:hypothetical protein
VTNWNRIVLTAAALAVSIACNNNSNSSPTSPSTNRATFTLAVRPSPITATHCQPQCSSDSGSSFPYAANMTIALQETAGVGATVNSMTLTASADGTTFSPLNFTADDINRQAGSNHVVGRSTLSIPVTIVYNTPSGNTNLAISVSLQITDDQNHQMTATGQVNVL